MPIARNVKLGLHLPFGSSWRRACRICRCAMPDVNACGIVLFAFEGADAESAGARCSENCSCCLPQNSTGCLCKILILLMINWVGHLPWAQGVGRSNAWAPTIP